MYLQQKPALLLVDIQKGFGDTAYWGGNRNNPGAEENAARLLKLWRELELPVFHVKHNSTTPGSPLVKGQVGNEIQEIVEPLLGEPVIEKNVNSGFIGTDLKQRLESSQIKRLVVAGLTTDHCISTTVRMAGNLGFSTYVVSDASATFKKTGSDGNTFSAELIHQTALASLHREFATVLTTEEVKLIIKSE